MASEAKSLPQISHSRAQWVRLIAVGVLAAIALGRVVPDAIRIVYPLGIFGYATDGNGVVDRIPEKVPRGSDRILPGDRVRIDRIPAFDRKPGLAGPGSFTYDNRDRYLPVDRSGRALRLHLIARDEAPSMRVTTTLKILLFVLVVCASGILFLVQPSIATAAIFAYFLGGEFPSTYAGVAPDVPWREIPQWAGDLLAGAARPALLLFALCLSTDDERTERVAAAVLCVVAVALGTLHGYGDWRLTYAGLPAAAPDILYARISDALAALTIVIFGLAFVRAKGQERRRTGWVVVSFALAGAAQLISDAAYPARLGPGWNDLLLATTALPIAAVWFAAIRHRALNVDLVVGRAIVYTALTGAVLGAITLAEEVGTYVFYQNTDLAYGFLIAISLAVGSMTGKVKELLDHAVDRFVFRGRHDHRAALDLIGGYVLDAEHEDDVYRALLEDATHALALSFAGVLTRGDDGNYRLTRDFAWPESCDVHFGAQDEFTKAIARARGAVTFTGKESRLIRDAFPDERLTFAAPLFFDRTLTAIVVFGQNVSGLDLDSDERELLVRVVTHASIALTALELERYRANTTALVPQA
jgi:type IV secretory pathway VirB2 component (pilin)